MKNRISIFAVLAIVCSMIIAPVQYSEARSESETLLRIANQALDQVQKQIRSTDNTSPEIKRLYEQGVQEVELLKIAINKENPEEAKKHFLLAMEIFKKISHSSSQNQELRAAPQATSSRPDLTSDIDRLEKYVISLKTIAKKHNIEIDFGKINELFDTARQENSKGNYDATVRIIDDLKRVIIDVNKVLREDADQRKTDKARSFAQQYLKLLDRLISEMEGQDYSGDIIAKIKEARDRLANSSDPEEIIKEVRQILSFKQQFDLTKADRIKNRLGQLEQNIEKLSTNNDIPKNAIAEAKKLVDKLKSQIKNGQYDSAQITLKELTDMVRSLQNSVTSS